MKCQVSATGLLYACVSTKTSTDNFRNGGNGLQRKRKMEEMGTEEAGTEEKGTDERGQRKRGRRKRG